VARGIDWLPTVGERNVARTGATGRPWRSVRFRITVVATVAVVIVLSIGGFVLLAIQENQVLDNLDTTLSQRADDLASVTQDLDLSTTPLTLTNLAGDDVIVQLVDEDGGIIAGSANAVDVPPIGPLDPVGQTLRTVETLPVEDDEYRILTRPIELDAGPAVLHVATNMDELRDVITQLRNALLLVVPLAALVISAVVWALVGRTLRPVERIRSEVASIDGGDRSHRISPPATGDEIERLAVTMNELLERQAVASRRQREFVADASHELRSPLARMRTDVDVGRTDGLGTDAVLASLSDEIDHMTSLVDDLLHLARSDSADTPHVRRPVDLDDIVLDEAKRVGSSSEITVDLSAMSAAHLSGDPNQLRRMVRNLLDNAVRHATHTVSVTLSESSAGVITLTVTDDGPGVDFGDRERVFERFVRLDRARTRHDGGTGLGLAITRDIVERHGGTITLDEAGAPYRARGGGVVPN
jgi:signal transduction histidine kinase